MPHVVQSCLVVVAAAFAHTSPLDRARLWDSPSRVALSFAAAVEARREQPLPVELRTTEAELDECVCLSTSTGSTDGEEEFAESSWSGAYFAFDAGATASGATVARCAFGGRSTSHRRRQGRRQAIRQSVPARPASSGEVLVRPRLVA